MQNRELAPHFENGKRDLALFFEFYNFGEESTWGKQ